MFFLTLNRPLSIHLALYKSHFSSIMSIFHRLCGLCCILFLFYFPVFLIASFSFVSFHLFYFIYCFIFACTFLFLFFSLFLFYHTINGIRHIYWDFFLSLNISNVIFSSYIIMLKSLFFFILIALN